MNLNQYRLKDTTLYLVTNADKFNSEDEFLDAAASALKGGVDIIQLCGKNASAKKCISLGKKIRELCSIYNAIFIVNDRIDIAKIVNADGVHLGQEDVDIKSAREILGSSAIVGISTHSPEEALKAQKDGADYIWTGTVFPTKKIAGASSVGLDYVKWAEKNMLIPFFAIGGIDEHNCNEVILSGAKRIAVEEAIINSVSPEKAAKLFKQKLSNE